MPTPSPRPDRPSSDVSIHTHFEAIHSAFREEIFRSISEIDIRLREHIRDQVNYLKEALDSADKLDVQRIHEVVASVDALRNEVKLSFEASEKAILKAENSVERRFESVNEFRQSLSNQTNTFMPRLETEQRIGASDEKINSMIGRVDRIEARAQGQGAMVVHILSVVGTITAVIVAIFAVLRTR